MSEPGMKCYKFQYSPSHEGARSSHDEVHVAYRFQYSPSHEGARLCSKGFGHFRRISILPLSRGGSSQRDRGSPPINFNTPPLTRGLKSLIVCASTGAFQYSPSHEGAHISVTDEAAYDTFQYSPSHEGAQQKFPHHSAQLHFNTPPLTRGLCEEWYSVLYITISILPLSRGGSG